MWEAGGGQRWPNSQPIPRRVRTCLHYKIGKIKTLLWALREDVSRKTGTELYGILLCSFSTEETPSLPEEVYPSSCLSIPPSLPWFSGKSRKLNYFLPTSYPHIKIKKKKTALFCFLNIHIHIHAHKLTVVLNWGKLEAIFIKTQLRATRWCFNLIFFFF